MLNEKICVIDNSAAGEIKNEKLLIFSTPVFLLLALFWHIGNHTPYSKMAAILVQSFAHD